MSLSSAKRKPDYFPGHSLRMHLISDLPNAADIRPYLERMDVNRWYTNFGPLVCEFEQKLTSLLNQADPGSRPIHLTTMTSCYQALETGLRFLGVQSGGRVLVPAITFPGCADAVHHADGEVVFADIDPTSWVLTPETARRAAEKIKLTAVMPTALYGIPLPAATWDDFVRDTGIPVIIDAAAAVETQAIPHHALVAHSLHATKPFGVGEGGLLVSRDPDIVNRVRTYSNFGMIDRVAQMDGVNAKMSEYHAAVGLAQHARWNGIKQKRRATLEFYQDNLEALKDIATLHPAIDEAVTSLLMLRFKFPITDDLFSTCREEGIALHRTYLPPLYHHPHFNKISVINEDGELLSGDAALSKKLAHMPNSEMLFRHIAGVPFHPFLTEDDIMFVASTLQKIATSV